MKKKELVQRDRHVYIDMTTSELHVVEFIAGQGMICERAPDDYMERLNSTIIKDETEEQALLRIDFQYMSQFI